MYSVTSPTIFDCSTWICAPQHGKTEQDLPSRLQDRLVQLQPCTNVECRVSNRCHFIFPRIFLILSKRLAQPLRYNTYLFVHEPSLHLFEQWLWTSRLTVSRWIWTKAGSCPTGSAATSWSRSLWGTPIFSSTPTTWKWDAGCRRSSYMSWYLLLYFLLLWYSIQVYRFKHSS